MAEFSKDVSDNEAESYDAMLIEKLQKRLNDPSLPWVDNFVKTHPKELQKKKGKSVPILRWLGATPEIIEPYFFHRR